MTALLLLGTWLAPAPSQASGFATARFGGAHRTAADVAPTALYYNPGAIGLLDGHHLQMDLTLALRTASYERAPSAIDPSTLQAAQDAGLERQAAIDALSGEGRLTDVIPLPFAGVVTDLGLPDSPLRLGAAVFVPFGGQSAWDEQPADARFFGQSDGPARWYNIEGTIRTLAASAGAAYRFEAIRLSLGVSATAYLSQVNTVRARNANATDNLVATDGSLAEGRSLLNVSGVHIGVGAGVLWEAIARTLWLGASYQSQPGFGRMQLTGTLDNTLGSAPPAPSADVLFTEELPDIVRIGVRGRPVPTVELRLGADWTRWSQLDQMCLAKASVTDVDATCATNADGSLVNPEHASEVVQVFARNWRDSVGVNVGGSYFLSDGRIELYAGAAYDGNAIPDRTLDPALFDMDKVDFTLGASFMLTDRLRLTLSAIEVLYLTRDTRGQAGNEALAPPSRQPANAGRYTQNIFILQPGAELSF